MAPSAATNLLAKESCITEMTVDRNQKEVRPSSCPKRPATNGDLNERSRKLIKSCFGNLRSNLNVLVIGPKESGKSSLINSMHMALTQEWKDRAKYCPGKNHTVDQCVLFRTKDSQHARHNKVVFWDTRGFEDIHCDEHAVLILRYVLEGRIPSQCIPCVLLMEKELIKKRYQKSTTSERRIDLVLNVAALSQEPQTRLMNLLQQAIASSKLSSVNTIPILSVATKCDTLTDEQMEGKLKRLHEYDLEHFVDEQRNQCRTSNRRRHPTAPEPCLNTKLIVNYCQELEPWSDESVDPSSVKPSVDLDTKLLALWRDIVARTAACGASDQRKRLFSANSKSVFRCLPFHFPYSRLRSHSF